MTQLLEQAYAKIASLPETEQDAIAALILEELEDEERWNQQFAASADKLSRLAQKALQDYRQGKTLPLLAMREDYCCLKIILEAIN